MNWMPSLDNEIIYLRKMKGTKHTYQLERKIKKMNEKKIIVGTDQLQYTKMEARKDKWDELKVVMLFNKEGFLNEAIGKKKELAQLLDDQDYLEALKEIATKYISFK